jgi:acyl carrier protein
LSRTNAARGLAAPAFDESVEPRVRRLVSTHLGVGLEQLVADVSLRDDLAADSLDLAELALALEGTFTIVVPDRILASVRTYHDLVVATGRLIERQAVAL